MSESSVVFESQPESFEGDAGTGTGTSLDVTLNVFGGPSSRGLGGSSPTREGH